MSGKRKLKQPKERKRAKATFAGVGPKDLLRALNAEQKVLQKVHFSLRTHVQQLEVEELALKQMIRREITRQQQKQQQQQEAQPEPDHQGHASNAAQVDAAMQH
mmetsp:Transcript_23609/g.60334  ORF Transcript_23609/g.60334 Transcript_23609/m.60334 type:complete len:104 (-) Transcript_23609:408-719(-)|eukprot:CAMPEP_0202877746 /NCGR_PEP_ID=MMETSP1391-20130828/31101_1 /ASSEMBLY_ACC=CAM_ASM_000867 /TAXON_ID=1034604 /ORGANISM="Chlamydomonas leiostraca, Strain SAG 11-49" /LENGTH=103 /DNA_ID=CAMNT_0049559827 /DNA_START=85 /DNA_END=396 /DNA_ORIENTATION=-